MCHACINCPLDTRMISYVCRGLCLADSASSDLTSIPRQRAFLHLSCFAPSLPVANIAGIPTSLPFRHTSSLSTSVCATATHRLDVDRGNSIQCSHVNHFLKSLTSHEHVINPSTTDPMILDGPDPLGIMPL